MKSRFDLAVSDLGATQLKNIAEPVHVYSIEVGKQVRAKRIKITTRKRRFLFALVGAGIVVLILVTVAAWHFFGEIDPRPSPALVNPRISPL